MDCLEGMTLIDDGAVDMILCDLPYGTTELKWDTVLPFDLLWSQYKRVIKKSGAIVLFSAQPFTTALINSNRSMFRYEWIWVKPVATGFLNANRAPLRAHENICVFYDCLPTYNPQKTTGHNRVTKNTSNLKYIKGEHCYGNLPVHFGYDSTERYPRDVQVFGNCMGSERIHPAQKPIDLCEFLIKTYTTPGDLVFDNCAGSGTTCIACINTGRRYIAFEKDSGYYDLAKRRIEYHGGQISFLGE
jgi:site-specific DNA-methyltransferase (adenine-specific)